MGGWVVISAEGGKFFSLRKIFSPPQAEIFENLGLVENSYEPIYTRFALVRVFLKENFRPENLSWNLAINFWNF